MVSVLRSAKHDHAPDRPQAGASREASRYIRPVGRFFLTALSVCHSRAGGNPLHHACTRSQVLSKSIPMRGGTDA